MEFIINEHNVCINPIQKTFKCIKKYSAHVSVAKFNYGTWSFSHGFFGNSGGWSVPCWDRPTRRYGSQEEAYNAGIKDLLRCVKESEKDGKYSGIIKMLEDELNPVIDNQLTLF